MSDPALPADPADWSGPEDDEPMPDELRSELAAPNVRKLVDPRMLPARISHLRAAGVSGAHCLHAFQDDDDDSLSKRLGSGTHALLLGKPTALWEQESEASKKARDKALKLGKPIPKMTMAPRSGGEWEKFRKQNPGATILIRSEIDAARRMVDAIRANAHADRLLSVPDLICERTIFWSQLGRTRRSTPDIRALAGAHGPSFNAEIKTTRSAAPFWFALDAKRMAYHAQLADQAAAIEFETGSPPRESYIIAVENSRPHVVQVYEVPQTILEAGAKLVAIWMERLAMYEATNMWGGYSPRIETLEFIEHGGAVADPGWVTDDKEPGDAV